MPQRPPIFRPYDRPKRDDSAYDRNRGTAAQRGYDSRWQRFRAVYIQHNPLCRRCKAKGRITATKEVHHIVPLRDAPERKYDTDNLEPLCKSCHSKATRKERK